MRSPLARLARSVHRLGLHRRVAVLLRDVGVDRLGGRVQEIAAQARDRPVRRRLSRARGRSDQRARRRSNSRTFQSGIAFAVREPAAEEAIAARHRVGRGGRRAVRERIADRCARARARRARRRPRTAPSRGGPAPRRSSSAGRSLPTRARSRARRSAARRATVSSRLPESTTTVSAANGADAMHAASSWAASRVITMSDRGSDSDIDGVV